MIYQVGPGYDVRDFLITDPRLAEILGQGNVLKNTCETLLVSEDEEGLAMSLFLDGEMLGRLEDANPFEQLRPEQLEDFCTVLEGISHFNCVAWKASQDRAVSLLELELQAEVDKFVTTTLLALAQRDNELLRRLHGWLFDEVSFHEDLADDDLERYRAANEYAARFCQRLSRCLLDDDARALSELRRFFRLQLPDKISHIHSRVLSAH